VILWLLSDIEKATASEGLSLNVVELLSSLVIFGIFIGLLWIKDRASPQTKATES